MQDYNCNGSIDSSYGASAYSTCTSTVGAPDTGTAQATIASGGFTVLLPVAIALILVTIASIIMRRKKKRSRRSTDA